MITRFISDTYSLVYDHQTGRLLTPEGKLNDYGFQSFWQVMLACRQDCIKKGITYTISQVPKEDTNADHNTVAV